MSGVERRAGSARRHAGLGTSRLFWAFAIVLAVEMCFDLGVAAGSLLGDHAVLRIAMWLILIVADVAITVVTRALGGHLPTWLTWMFVAALGIVVLMDLVSVWDAPDPGRALTAAASAGMSLVLAVPTRAAAEIAAAIGVLAALLVVGLALAGGFAATAPGLATSPATDSITVLCRVCGVVVAAALVTLEFRRLVRRELEQTLSAATLTASRLALGGEQSDQLVRLDLAAESLLDAVADGRAPLPLAPEIAQRAARLATELRLHLLESRSRTWLDLAVAESEILGATILVEDAAAGAGLLSTRQRGALLSALWLLAERRGGRRRATAETAKVEIAAPVPEPEGRAALRIAIAVPWSTRSRVDPGVWEHLAQVGRYYEANAGRGLAVEIDALVAAPGLAAAPHGMNGPGIPPPAVGEPGEQGRSER